MPTINVTVNGMPCPAEIRSRELLVHFLRDRLALTGTTIGCDTSQCGACTVVMDGRAVKSCTLLAVQADGRQILTVEGLARNGELHPLQQAFWDHHGLQCGFCTPGMLMTAYALLQEDPNPSDEQIRWELEGNLCRCTGYQKIVESVQAAAAMLRQAQPVAEQPTAEKPVAEKPVAEKPAGEQGRRL